MNRKFLSLVCAALACFMAASSANAAIFTTYGFDVVFDEDNTGVEGQLFLQVVDVGPGKVRFDFRNMGPMASSVTDVYFDDGTLLGISSINESAGVIFTQDSISPVAPGTPYEGASIEWNTSAGYATSADSESPTVPNGINPTEWLSVTFNLLSGQTYQDVIAAMDLSLQTPGEDVFGGLRVAVNVNVPNQESPSFVNGQPLPVGAGPAPLPEPATLAIWGAGLGIAGLVRLRRKK